MIHASRQELPSTGVPRGRALLEAIYAGEVFRAPATDASRALVSRVRGRLETELAPAGSAEAGAIELAARRMAPDAHFDSVGRVRAWLREDEGVVALAWQVVADLGLSLGGHTLDVPRLRAVPHEGHLEPKAAPAYYAHRDTWYANPRAQLNVWIPLHDVTVDETFAIYPSVFARPVKNDSGAFDYYAFEAAVGWQRPDPPEHAVYPRALEPLANLATMGIDGRAGEIVLFSAAHLHEPRAHASGRTRFSIDFRTVHLGDHVAGRGAPNVDDASRGSTMRDHLRRDG